LKNINQLNYKKIDFLFKNEQTTIALLSNFVKEEIAYFTNVQVDNSIENSAIRSSTQSLNSNTPESKIHFKLTVEQIAYFGKAMIESNIVDDSNKQELFKVASLFISSINQHQITHKSLSAKFYNPSQITIDTVRGLIIKMLNYTNK
jgi:hypothetical protein